MQSGAFHLPEQGQTTCRAICDRGAQRSTSPQLLESLLKYEHRAFRDKLIQMVPIYSAMGAMTITAFLFLTWKSTRDSHKAGRSCDTQSFLVFLNTNMTYTNNCRQLLQWAHCRVIRTGVEISTPSQREALTPREPSHGYPRGQKEIVIQTHSPSAGKESF